ncbi:MAG: hypothetical protein JWQ97_902 [Phenylobacterium sp.]|nr:hypothetical protein [Phenylobacterium sp.]
MARLMLLATVVALGAGGAALGQTSRYTVTVTRRPQPAFEKLHVSKAALGSAEILLWANTAIDPTCQAMTPGATLSILEAPAHGVARVSDEPFYAAYPPNNPRAVCNDRKIAGHQAFYAAAPGFKGRDRVVLQGASPEGRVREIRVDVDVR